MDNQIEEIVEVFGEWATEYKMCLNAEHATSLAKWLIGWAICQGYRKIPEGAVVQTKEQFDSFLEDYNQDLRRQIKLARKLERKETVEKLSDKVHRKMEPYMQPHTLYSQKEKELFKVFLDKFDEICNEITEGK